MSWKVRLGIFILGTLTACLGVARFLHGPLVYQSMRGQSVSSTNLIAIGAVISLLAFLPPGKWVYEHITTRGRLKIAGKSKRHRSTSTQK